MILVINGHPGRESLSSSIAEIYAEAARSARASVRILHLSQLKFDPILHEGYRVVQELEPDLREAQALIREARHLVICYPQWWGTGPALLKGFLDRVLLPDFAFRYHEKGPFWDKLLKGRSAEIWMTSDSPKLWYFLKYWNSPVKWLKTATLEFCGIEPVQVHAIDRIRMRKPEEIRRALEGVRVSARKAAGSLPR